MPHHDENPDPPTSVPELPVTTFSAVTLPRGALSPHASGERNTTMPPVREPGEAFGYARSRLDGQSERSIERQMDDIQRLARAEGLRLTSVYVDREASGTRSDREGLQTMLGFLRSAPNRPSTVVVEGVDRLARDAGLLTMLWDELRKLGIALHDTRDGLVDIAPFTGPGGGDPGPRNHHRRRGGTYRTRRSS